MGADKKIDMCNGPIFINVVKYTLPIIFTGILQLLFNAADLVVAGRFCGSNAVGAVGATGSLTNLIVNFFIGFSVGATVCASTAIGAGNKRALHRIIHTAIPFAIIGGAILTVVGVLLSGEFLRLMDTPEDIIELSAVYMRIYFCGSIPSMVYNFGAAILRAAGDTSSPLKFLTISGIINVILNIFFVTVFDMNVAGVALATIISQAVSAILVLKELVFRKDDCKLFLSHLKIYPEQLKKIVGIGFSAGLQSSLFSISNVLIQSSINSFGATSVAGNAAAGNIEGFMYTSMNSFSQTAINFTGQNAGAENYKRIKKIMKVCILNVTVVGIFLSVIARVFAPQLLSIYITDNNAAIDIGVIRITYFLVYFICGIMEVLTGVIRGLGNTTVPMLISVVCVCVFRVLWIFTVFRIPEFHSLESLYISYPISWTLCVIAQIVAFNKIFKKVTVKNEA